MFNISYDLEMKLKPSNDLNCFAQFSDNAKYLILHHFLQIIYKFQACKK
jgi:hypothetical protein